MKFLLEHQAFIDHEDFFDHRNDRHIAVGPDLRDSFDNPVDRHTGGLHILPLHLCVGQFFYSVGDCSHAHASGYDLLLPGYRDLLDNTEATFSDAASRLP